jgi:hypothetical protein
MLVVMTGRSLLEDVPLIQDTRLARNESCAKIRFLTTRLTGDPGCLRMIKDDHTQP